MMQKNKQIKEQQKRGISQSKKNQVLGNQLSAAVINLEKEKS